MKHNAHILFLIFLTLCGCQKHAGFRQQLTFADSLMRTDAAAAFDTLCALDSLAARMPEDLRMEYLLLRCNAQNKADSLFSSDSLGLRLTRYYDRHGTPNQRMLAHYVLGCAYRDMGDHPAAIRCFNEAVTAADTSATDCNFYQLSIIYGQLGGLCCTLGYSNEALDAFHWAERYAIQQGDTFRILNIWANKSNAYIRQNRIQEALELKERAADELLRLGYRKEAAQTKGLCIAWLSERGELEKAKAYMDEYERYSGYFMKNGNIRQDMVSYYETKGFYFLKVGYPDSAEYYYRKLGQYAQTIDNKKGALWGLSQLYVQLGNTDSVAKYSYLYNLLSDEATVEQEKQSFQQNQSKYRYDRYKQMAQKKDKEVKSFRAILLYVLPCIVVVVAALWLFLHKKYRNKVQTQNTTIASYEEREQRRESSLKENALFNEEIVLQFIRDVKKATAKAEDEDLRKLEVTVEKYYPSMRQLKERYQISDTDYYICLFIKLKFRLKDIGNLLGIDKYNLSTKRRNIFKKIFGKIGTTEEFDQYIGSIALASETLPEI